MFLQSHSISCFNFLSIKSINVPKFSMEDSSLRDAHLKCVVPQRDELPPSTPYAEECASSANDLFEEINIPLPPPTFIPTKVLDVDKNTPDSHVPRDPRLIRLTGNHPFNVEAPLSTLYDQGFLTSQELFYVRNHGAVPKVEEQSIFDWEFTVEG